MVISSLILKMLIAFIFLLAVFAKLAGRTNETFEKAGYSDFMIVFIATVELIFSIGLFTEYELLSISVLLAIMAGAAFTLLKQKAAPSRYFLLVITVLLLIGLLVKDFS